MIIPWIRLLVCVFPPCTNFFLTSFLVFDLGEEDLETEKEKARAVCESERATKIPAPNQAVLCCDMHEQC